jgi:hypothetical protein
MAQLRGEPTAGTTLLAPQLTVRESSGELR